MAELSSALTYYDLILRVAETAGVAFYGATGQEKSHIPVDSNTLDRCKRCVNEAIKDFIASAPQAGWRWQQRICEITVSAVQTTGTADAGTNATHLIDLALADTYTTTNEIVGYYAYITGGTGKGSYAVITAYNKTTGDCTVVDWLTENGDPGGTDPTTGSTYSITAVQTVQGDKARYLLPQDFGRVTGKITYQAASRRGHFIGWAHEGQVRDNREVVIIKGYPRIAGVRPYNSRRWEIFFDPSPVATDTFLFPYEVGFTSLVLEAGTATAGGSNYITDGSLVGKYPNDYFNGWIIKVISGTGENNYAVVTDYTGTSGKFDVADWLGPGGGAATADPTTNSIYYLEPVNNRHPAGIQFDPAILSACLAKTQMQFDGIQTDYVGKFYNQDLPLAWKMDERTAPRKLALGSERVEERVWKKVSTVNMR